MFIMTDYNSNVVLAAYYIFKRKVDILFTKIKYHRLSEKNQWTAPRLCAQFDAFSLTYSKIWEQYVRADIIDNFLKKMRD